MPSPQNVYTALSIISLGGLIGMGVAVGSGVSMMAMAMAEEEQKMVAPSVVEKPSTGRGFDFHLGHLALQTFLHLLRLLHHVLNVHVISSTSSISPPRISSTF